MPTPSLGILSHTHLLIISIAEVRDIAIFHVAAERSVFIESNKLECLIYVNSRNKTVFIANT
jgi:hypothetical protein